MHIKSVHNITWDKWYGSIQLALNDAVNNDVIEVSEGTWNETIDFNGVNCVLRSTASNNYDIVVGTIINANGGTAVTFDSGEGSGAVLQGLTLTGGTHGTIMQQFIESDDKKLYRVRQRYGNGVQFG